MQISASRPLSREQAGSPAGDWKRPGNGGGRPGGEGRLNTRRRRIAFLSRAGWHRGDDAQERQPHHHRLSTRPRRAALYAKDYIGTRADASFGAHRRHAGRHYSRAAAGKRHDSTSRSLRPEAVSYRDDDKGPSAPSNCCTDAAAAEGVYGGGAGTPRDQIKAVASAAAKRWSRARIRIELSGARWNRPFYPATTSAACRRRAAHPHRDMWDLPPDSPRVKDFTIDAITSRRIPYIEPARMRVVIKDVRLKFCEGTTTDALFARAPPPSPLPHSWERGLVSPVRSTCD